MCPSCSLLVTRLEAQLSHPLDAPLVELYVLIPFFFLNNVYSHKEKKIQCRYESPREEAREGHDYLVLKRRIESVLHQALPRGE
jgi:hypothetical protein